MRGGKNRLAALIKTSVPKTAERTAYVFTGKNHVERSFSPAGKRGAGTQGDKWRGGGGTNSPQGQNSQVRLRGPTLGLRLPFTLEKESPPEAWCTERMGPSKRHVGVIEYIRSFALAQAPGGNLRWGSEQHGRCTQK